MSGQDRQFDVALHPSNPDAVGYLERSLSSSPVWQMGARELAQDVTRRDPRLLDFLASAKNAPLGELEFDVLTWLITRWFQEGRPENGRLMATLGEVAYSLYGGRHGGSQYALVRESLDRLYNVSLDLTLITVDEGNEAWVGSKKRRILSELTIHERASGAMRSTSTVEIRLGQWLVEQLDAHTVAAIGWQVLRGLSGIAKRLAVWLAARSGEFAPITEYTERLTVQLSEDLYEEFGITAARERDRRSSIARAATKIAEKDRRYQRMVVERVGDVYVLRVDRARQATVLQLPGLRKAPQPDAAPPAAG